MTLKRHWIEFEDSVGYTWKLVHDPRWDGPLERFTQNPFFTVTDDQDIQVISKPINPNEIQRILVELELMEKQHKNSDKWEMTFNSEKRIVSHPYVRFMATDYEAAIKAFNQDEVYSVIISFNKAGYGKQYEYAY